MSPIEARGLTKRFGRVTAVDDATFSVQPGEVTGFLRHSPAEHENVGRRLWLTARATPPRRGPRKHLGGTGLGAPCRPRSRP